MTAPNERTMWTAPHGLADVTLDDWGLFRVRTRDSYGRWHHIHAGYSTFERARMTAEIADNARAYKEA